MKFVPTDRVPKRGYHKLQSMIEEFVNGPYDVVKIQIKENEYKNAKACCSSLYGAVRRSGYKIKIYMRGGDIYLEK